MWICLLRKVLSCGETFCSHLETIQSLLPPIEEQVRKGTDPSQGFPELQGKLLKFGRLVQ